jgi:hypothetical protein
MIAIAFDQATAASSNWTIWGPGLAGVVLGFLMSEAVSYLKARNARRREHRRFLADQANRLMEDIVKVFFGAKNQLGYLASELIQIDRSIAAAELAASKYAGVTADIPEASELEQNRKAREKCLEDAYANLKRYHAQGEPSVKLLCSMPLKIDLAFLERFLAQVTETYQFDTEGVIKQCHLYESLHDEVLAVRKRVLDELLSLIRR